MSEVPPAPNGESGAPARARADASLTPSGADSDGQQESPATASEFNWSNLIVVVNEARIVVEPVLEEKELARFIDTTKQPAAATDRGCGLSKAKREKRADCWENHSLVRKFVESISPILNGHLEGARIAVAKKYEEYSHIDWDTAKARAADVPSIEVTIKPPTGFDEATLRHMLDLIDCGVRETTKQSVQMTPKCLYVDKTVIPTGLIKMWVFAAGVRHGSAVGCLMMDFGSAIVNHGLREHVRLTTDAKLPFGAGQTAPDMGILARDGTLKYVGEVEAENRLLVDDIVDEGDEGAGDVKREGLINHIRNLMGLPDCNGATAIKFFRSKNHDGTTNVGASKAVLFTVRKDRSSHPPTIYVDDLVDFGATPMTAAERAAASAELQVWANVVAEWRACPAGMDGAERAVVTVNLHPVTEGIPGIAMADDTAVNIDMTDMWQSMEL